MCILPLLEVWEAAALTGRTAPELKPAASRPLGHGHMSLRCPIS